MMKYFTLDDWIADQELGADVEPGVRAQQAYAAYLESVHHQLPNDWHRLLKTVLLHDGRVRKLHVDVAGRSASLQVDASDLTGEDSRRVVLHYGDLIESITTADPSKGLPGPFGYGDILIDEIEVLGNGVFEHRLLFSTGIHLLFRFSTFRFDTLQ
jgi:hypothetical protein